MLDSKLYIHCSFSTADVRDFVHHLVCSTRNNRNIVFHLSLRQHSIWIYALSKQHMQCSDSDPDSDNWYASFYEQKPSLHIFAYHSILCLTSIIPKIRSLEMAIRICKQSFIETFSSSFCDKTLLWICNAMHK